MQGTKRIIERVVSKAKMIAGNAIRLGAIYTFVLCAILIFQFENLLKLSYSDHLIFFSTVITCMCLVVPLLVSFFKIFFSRQCRFNISDWFCLSAVVVIYLGQFHLALSYSTTSVGVSYFLSAFVTVLFSYGLLDYFVWSLSAWDDDFAITSSEIRSFIPIRYVWANQLSVLITCYIVCLFLYAVGDAIGIQESGCNLTLVMLVLIFYQPLLQCSFIESSQIDLHEQGLVIGGRLCKWDENKIFLFRRTGVTLLVAENVSLWKGILRFQFPYSVPQNKVEELQRIIDEHKKHAENT